MEDAYETVFRGLQHDGSMGASGEKMQLTSTSTSSAASQGNQRLIAHPRSGRQLCGYVNRRLAGIGSIVSELLMSTKEVLLTLRGLFTQKRMKFEPYEESECYISMEGKTVLITGASSGVGLAIAKELARCRARVILAICDRDGTADPWTSVYLETDYHVFVRRVDLSSFASIWEFAADIIEKEPRLDVLINAAAMTSDSYKVTTTEDDNEVCMQTNYIGHVLLTHFLLDLIKKSAPSRIINVSCNVHSLGSVDDILKTFSDSPRHFVNPGRAYHNSKLAQVLFTQVLASELRGSGVTVNTADPGVMQCGTYVRYPGLQGALIRRMRQRYGKTAREGAQTCVYLAADPSVAQETGKYYLDSTEHQPVIDKPDFALMKEIHRLTLCLTYAEEAATIMYHEELRRLL